MEKTFFLSFHPSVFLFSLSLSYFYPSLFGFDRPFSNDPPPLLIALGIFFAISLCLIPAEWPSCRTCEWPVILFLLFPPLPFDDDANIRQSEFSMALFLAHHDLDVERDRLSGNHPGPLRQDRHRLGRLGARPVAAAGDRGLHAAGPAVLTG